MEGDGMKRNAYLIVAVLASMACVMAHGGEYLSDTVTVTAGTNKTYAITQDVAGVVGELVQIEIDETVAGADADIDITVLSDVSTMGAVTIYSADDVTADTVLYPAFDRTDTAGAALTSDDPGTHVLYKDTLRTVISDWNATGKVFKVKFKWRVAR